MPKGLQVKDMAIMGVRKGSNKAEVLHRDLPRTSAWDLLTMCRKLVDPKEWVYIFVDRQEGTEPPPDGETATKGKK